MALHRVPGRKHFHTLGSRKETQSLNNRFFVVCGVCLLCVHVAYAIRTCGVVWCGVVWCGVVWCGVVWCGVVWVVVVGTLCNDDVFVHAAARMHRIRVTLYLCTGPLPHHLYRPDGKHLTVRSKGLRKCCPDSA